MKKYAKLIITLGLAGGIMLAGCQKNETAEAEPTATPEPTQEAEATPEPTAMAAEEPEPTEDPIPDGYVVSYLTGEYVPESIGRRRPVAVMLNNLKPACPQAGIANAGVVYEAPVEGGITRLMGVFDQVFYRTTDRKSPHNAYTSFEGIQKGIEINGYSQEYDEDFQPGYAFCGVDDEVELPGETEVNVVKPGYFLNEPWFEYNPEDKLYYRFQYGDKQIDELTGEQIAYKNIILQYSSWRKYDENGYLNIDVDEPNVGKYIVNGKAIDITWKKHTPWGATFYYDTNGNQITMDTGKTWVCIIQDTYADRVEILGSDDNSDTSADTQGSEEQAAAEEAAASDTEY